MSNSYKQSNIVELVVSYVKHWKLFVLSFVICVGLAGAYILVKNPEFRINANILIKEDSKSGMSGLASSMMKTGIPFGDVLSVGGSAVDDEIEIINSYSILRETVKDLGLNVSCSSGLIKKTNYYQDSPLRITPANPDMPDTLRYTIEMKVTVDKQENVKVKAYYDGDLVGSVKSQFPAKLTTVFGDFLIEKTKFYDGDKSRKFKVYYSGYGSSTEALMRNVEISIASKKANVVNLFIDDEIPDRGKDILNSIIKNYNLYGIDEKNVTAVRTAEFLQQRIDLMAEDLSAVEREVEKYKEDNQLTDIGSEARIILEKSSDFKERLISAETQFSVISIIEDFLEAPENRYAVVPMSLGIEEESAVESLLAYNELLMERLKLLRSTNPGNPIIESMNEQVDATRQSVLMTIQSIKRGIEYARNDLREQEKTFNDRIKGMPKQEREYIAIKRQQEIKQALYLYLLQQQEDNALKLALENPKAQIIDNAYVNSRPVKPMKKLIAAAALLFTIILPIVYLYVRKTLNRKFHNARQLGNYTMLDVYMDIHSSCSPRLFTGQTETVDEDMRDLRSMVFRAMDNDIEHKVATVTSVMKGEGKTFVASNLALSVAMLGKKVLLIDANLRNSSLSTDILNAPAKGLTQVIQGQSDYKSVIQESSWHENLYVLPAGDVRSNAAEVLLSSAFSNLVNELESLYDFIVIDSANLYDYSDTMPLLHLNDLTIVVTRAGFSDKDTMEYIETLVNKEVISNYICIVNDVVQTSGR